MKENTPKSTNRDLLRQPLEELINPNHPLVKLSQAIDWKVFEEQWAGYFPSTTGRPATPSRLIAGLLYLQHTYALSDENVVMNWTENPYWQYFCGGVYFEHKLPINPSSMTRWRKRIGKEGVEALLAETILAAGRLGMVKESSFKRVIVDSTVMEKAIAYPTDSRLIERARQYLVKLAAELGISLRQNYNKVAPRLAVQVGRYAHAKQFKRMRGCLKKQKTLLSRIWRDIERQLPKDDSLLLQKAQSLLARIKRLLEQQPKDKNKIYSLHEDVDCIGKGKARIPYEFGTKVSVAVTHKEGLVVGMCSLPGNPFDGHTLEKALEQVQVLTAHCPKEVYVDKGYKGTELDGVTIWRSGQKRGVTPSIKKRISRRSAIEPAIGHMKTDGRLGRNWLKGHFGDTLHAVLCGAGHNLRLLLRALGLFCAIFLVWMVAFFTVTDRNMELEAS